MDQRNNLKVIRFSLILKVIIVVWSFYSAVMAESTSMSLFYLVFAIIFAGLFVFQLNYYREKTSAKESKQTDKKKEDTGEEKKKEDKGEDKKE